MSRRGRRRAPYDRKVSESQHPDLRIGDTERENALAALGEHTSAGRLDIEEYGERSARVTTCKTWGELIALFDDLPAPHPRFGPVVTPAQPAPPVPIAPRTPVAQRTFAALVPIAGLVALGLYLTVAHFWMIFLLPAVLMMISGSVWGEERKYQRQLAREEYKARRRELRRRGRGW